MIEKNPGSSDNKPSRTQRPSKPAASASPRAAKPTSAGRPTPKPGRSDSSQLSREANPSPGAHAQPDFSSWATLRKGSEDQESVRGLQQALNQRGANLEADGKFGTQTERALQDFQNRHGLNDDGVAGRATYGKLNETRPPSPPNGSGPSAPPTGPTPKAPDVFAFACKSMTPEQVRALAKDPSQSVMLGIDPSYAGSKATFEEAKKAGMRTHAYLGGPSGLTAGKWDKVEWNRLVKNAGQLGYDVNTKEGMAAWNQEGWKKYTDSQLKKAKATGFESAEIDNLDRAFGSDPKKLVHYYKEYADRFRSGDYPRLMMKNIDEKQMEAVSRAIGRGDLPREMFSDFHIWESNFGKNPPGRNAALSRALGIQTIESPDTNNYSASNIPALGREIWSHRKDPDPRSASLW